MAALSHQRGNMTYQDKVRLIRENIVLSAQVYRDILAGRYYLYIFEDQCFEMYFGTDNYLHLTGVGSALSPNQFYELAKNNQLQTNQIFFSSRFPMQTSDKKKTARTVFGAGWIFLINGWGVRQPRRRL